jgi:hypothetical protein
VTLKYIIGNFSGCFGETFSVLKEVRENALADVYKKNINSLQLTNIKLIKADATGTSRKYKIIKKIKSSK